MNTIDFSQPTIITAKQYGKTITIELDHSDTTIDEVFDGFLTILNGLGYLPSTINDYLKDKVVDIYDDEHTIIKNALYTDDDKDEWFDEEEKYSRMDIIGQNGNEGLHYDEDENPWGEDEETYLATDEDIEECEYNELSEVSELNDKLELPKEEYKGIYVEKPHFDWDDEELDWPVANDKLKAAVQRYSEEVKKRHTPISDFDRANGFNGKSLFEPYKKKPNQKVTEKKMNKSVVKKGKIKDLKK
jgi:hypothetical protein